MIIDAPVLLCAIALALKTFSSFAVRGQEHPISPMNPLLTPVSSAPSIISETISSAMYNALSLKYQADCEQARSTLLVYFSNPVGIGEHPQHLEELDKLIDKIAQAEEKLDALESFYIPRDE